MQCDAMCPCVANGCAIVMNVIEWSALCLGALEADMGVCMQKQDGGGVRWREINPKLIQNASPSQ